MMMMTVIMNGDANPFLFVVSFFKVHTCIESDSTISDYFALSDLTEICLIQQCGY